ncbi:MAG TPA: acetamidase/formamidase family protein [Gaiellaceae bacterium]
MIHELPLERRTLHGYFSRDLEPVLVIDPGDGVRFATPNAGWWLDDETRFDPISSPEDDGHALAGPIEVRGATEGQALVVHIDEVAPGSWGETFGDGVRVRWDLADGLGSALRRRVRLAPFLGVMGMPPVGHGVHSTVPPRPQGGNIDCKELVAGTTLFLPVPYDGACFSAGDGHAAQGDGEVSGTAIECPVRAQLTIDLRDDLALEWPCARIDDAWLTFGFDRDLTAAAWKANEGMLDLIEREHGLDRREALALASVVVDLRVTQLVNDVLGVHAVLRDDAFE